jgi:hypothetical protein
LGGKTGAQGGEKRRITDEHTERKETRRVQIRV